MRLILFLALSVPLATCILQLPVCIAENAKKVEARVAQGADRSVAQTDLKIVRVAQKILDSPAKWNRHCTRECPPNAKTFSLYCALEQATRKVTGGFEHRGTLMEEARTVIDNMSKKHYYHRLRDFNNDPKTTFKDIQRVLKLLEERNQGS